MIRARIDDHDHTWCGKDICNEMIKIGSMDTREVAGAVSYDLCSA